MTDDAMSLKAALKSVWPESKQLLCSWHFGQAYWTWLIDSKHGFKTNERQGASNDIEAMIFEKDEEAVSAQYETMLVKYSEKEKFIKKIKKDFSRRDEWCHAYRSNFYLPNIAKFRFTAISGIARLRYKGNKILYLIKILTSIQD